MSTFNRDQVASFKNVVLELVQSCCTEPVEIILHRARKSGKYQATARTGWTEMYCGRSNLGYMEALEDLKSQTRMRFKSGLVAGGDVGVSNVLELSGKFGM